MIEGFLRLFGIGDREPPRPQIQQKPPLPVLPEGSREGAIMAELQALHQEVAATLKEAEKALGRAMFKFFDFVDEQLPKKDVNQLRFYYKRAFFVYDKYMGLRDTEKDLDDEMVKFATGFSKYPELQSLLIKGAEKALEDGKKRFKSAK